MKRFPILILGLVTLVALLGVACGEETAEEAIERAAEREGLEADVDIQDEEVAISGETEEGEEFEFQSGGDLPEGFPGDFPVFPDARLVGGFRGLEGGEESFLVTWETDADVEEVADFYEDGLAESGWQVVNSGTFSTDGETTAFLEIQGEDSATTGGVTITNAEGTTTIIVALTAGE